MTEGIPGDNSSHRRIVRQILENYRDLLTSYMTSERKLLDDPKFTETIFRGYRLRQPVEEALMARGWIYDSKGRRIPYAAAELVELHSKVGEFWRDHGARLVQSIASISDSLPIVVRPRSSGELGNLGVYFDTVLMEDFFETTMTPEYRAVAEGEIDFWRDTLGDYLSFCAILETALKADTDHLPITFFPRSAMRQLGTTAFEENLAIVGFARRLAYSSLKELSIIKGDLGDIDEVSRKVDALTDIEATLALDKLGQSGRLGEVLPSLMSQRQDVEKFAKSQKTSFAKALLDIYIAQYAMRLREVLLLEQAAAPLQAVRGIPPASWYASVDATRTLQSNVVWGLGLPEDYRVLVGLQSSELEWLKNVSMTDMIRIREAGAMEELRSLFRSTRSRLQYASEVDFLKAAEDIARELHERLDDEQRRLKEEEALFKKRLGLTSVSFGVGTCFGLITGLLPALAPLTIPGVIVSAVVGSNSLTDLWKIVAKQRESTDHARNRPIGILLEARQAGNPPIDLRGWLGS